MFPGTEIVWNIYHFLAGTTSPPPNQKVSSYRVCSVRPLLVSSQVVQIYQIYFPVYCQILILLQGLTTQLTQSILTASNCQSFGIFGKESVGI